MATIAANGTHDQAAVEAALTQGLRGQWYPVAKSVQVKRGATFALPFMGEQLVLWRDEAGSVHCVEDYCPHRGAPLSRGEVIPEGLSCRYHGVTLDGTGTIVRVPAMADCPLEGRKAIAAYAVEEIADAIFLYLPSAENPEPLPFVPPIELAGTEWASFLCTSRWDCNYRYALDNLADPMHGCYLHAESFTLNLGQKQDTMRIERHEEGFRVERVAQQDVNFDWTEMAMPPGQMYCRLDIPYPASGGPGGPFRIIGYVTPLGENSCMVFFWRCRQVSGAARESWRLLYRAFWEARHWHVLEQDRVILEAMPTNARRRELLYQHDIGVTRLRQMMTRSAERQVAAEAAAAGAAIAAE